MYIILDIQSYMLCSMCLKYMYSQIEILCTHVYSMYSTQCSFKGIKYITFMDRLRAIKYTCTTK